MVSIWKQIFQGALSFNLPWSSSTIQSAWLIIRTVADQNRGFYFDGEIGAYRWASLSGSESSSWSIIRIGGALTMVSSIATMLTLPPEIFEPNSPKTVWYLSGSLLNEPVSLGNLASFWQPPQTWHQEQNLSGSSHNYSKSEVLGETEQPVAGVLSYWSCRLYMPMRILPDWSFDIKPAITLARLLLPQPDLSLTRAITLPPGSVMEKSLLILP